MQQRRRWRLGTSATCGCAAAGAAAASQYRIQSHSTNLVLHLQQLLLQAQPLRLAGRQRRVRDSQLLQQRRILLPLLLKRCVRFSNLCVLHGAWRMAHAGLM